VTARRALHVQTMRVRVNFVVVADVSFVPDDIFVRLPRLLYDPDDGTPAVEVVHPHWQLLDQHQAFCFPFRDPPLEPVFHRFPKDLTRYNLLIEKYPLSSETFLSDAAPRPVLGGASLPLLPFPVIAPVKEKELSPAALHGAAGVELLRTLAAMAGDNQGEKLSFPFHRRSDLVVEVNVRCPAGTPLALVTAGGGEGQVEKALSALGYEETARYRPLTDVTPEVVAARRGASAPAEYPDELYLYVYPAQLVASTEVADGVRLASPQFFLMNALLAYHAQVTFKGEVDLAPARAYPERPLETYLEVRKLLDAGAEALAPELPPEALNATPFSLTTRTTGGLNLGESQLLSLMGDALATRAAPLNGAVAALLPSREDFRRLPPMQYAPGQPRPGDAYLETPWFRRDGGVHQKCSPA